MSDLFVKRRIGGQANGVLKSLRFQKLVQLRQSEGGIGPVGVSETGA
jgi:hypothetical protein